VAMYVGAAREQAHDAVQEAMIEVFQRWEKVAHPWPWIRKAVVNRVIKTKKRDMHRLNREGRSAHGARNCEDPELTVWEDTEWVEHLLGKLPPAQREAMDGIVAGWRPSEIALLLGKTPAAVRKNLQLARERLQAELERERHSSGSMARCSLDEKEVGGDG